MKERTSQDECTIESWDGGGFLRAEDESVREAAFAIDQQMNIHQQRNKGLTDSDKEYTYGKIRQVREVYLDGVFMNQSVA